jgi:ubiquinone biosynthesis accessory factor UbiK
MNPQQLEEIARQIFSSISPAMRSVQDDVKNNMRIALQAGLAKLDLVSREEFESQRKVLERTREQLERLQTQVAALEAHNKPRN